MHESQNCIGYAFNKTGTNCEVLNGRMDRKMTSKYIDDSGVVESILNTLGNIVQTYEMLSKGPRFAFYFN